MAKEKFKISSARLEELEAELKNLKTVRQKEVAEHLKEARSFGDLSENSEYDEAKDEQAKLYGRIAEVENILANAVLIDDAEEKAGVIGLGCMVRIHDVDLDEDDDYEIVGSQEADPMNGRISDDSPFGRAMLGKKKGENVVVDAPAGQQHFKILSVERKV